MTIVLMPAAGKGQRFRDAGYDVIKPLVEFRLPTEGVFVEKRPMYQHALEGTNAWLCVAGFPGDNLSQISQGVLSPIAADGRDLGFYGCTFVPIGSNGGQLDTIAELLKHVANEEEDIIILNSDVSFRNGVLPIFCHYMQVTEQYEVGAVVVRREEDRVQEYSFVDSNNEFQWATEREWLSPWALAGAYWFRRKMILEAAIQVVVSDADPDHDERYLGETYLSHALAVTPGPMLAFPIADENYLEFGTPEKLRKVLDRGS